jgi:hypothetical protein
MSRRLTITLSDEEYAALEAEAAQERRSPREMAAYLVTRKPLLRQVSPYTPIITPYVAPATPYWPWTVTSGGTTDHSNAQNELTIWNGKSQTQCNTLN